MAEKKTTGGNKNAHQTRAEAAEALKKAAELIASLNSVEEGPSKQPAKKSTSTKSSASKSTAAKSTATKSTAKKPVSKSTASKSTSSKSTASKSTASKSTASKSTSIKSTATKTATKTAASKSASTKSTAKKPAAKATADDAVKEVQPVEEQKPVEEVAATTEGVSATEPVQEPAAEPVKEEVAPVEETKPVEEEKQEQPAPEQHTVREEQPAPEETKTETVTTTVVVEKTEKKKSGFAEKAKRALDKGRLPIFIAVNVLFVLSAVLLMVSAFNITSYKTMEPISCNMFAYFKNSAVIKDMLLHTSLDWASCAYVFIGILMIIAVVVPLALVIKNIVLLLVKKGKISYRLDAVVTVAFMLAYIAIVGLLGANITAGQIVAFVIAMLTLVLVAFTLTVSRSDAKIPFFSFAAIVAAVLSVFLISQTPIYNASNGSWFAVSASAQVGGAGALIFIGILLTVLTLVAMIVLQLKDLPKLVMTVISAVAIVCAILSLVISAVELPKGLTLGGGYIAGVIVSCVTALTVLIFTAVKPLHKFVVFVDAAGSDEVAEENTAESTTVTVTTSTSTYSSSQVETNAATADAKAEAANVEKTSDAANSATTSGTATAGEQSAVYCHNCGRKNAGTAKFCYNCGSPIKRE